MQLLKTYLQHFIFFVAYEWAQQARVLVHTRLERLACDKNSSLLGKFMSYKENEVLWMWILETYSQHFIFFVAYKWAQQARVYNYTRLERLSSDKNSSLLGQFMSYEQN
jgi:hypothetical protein